MALTLNSAALRVAALAPWQKSDHPWDVIAYTSIRVELGHHSRSHSLYYVDFEAPGQYGWFELGFMGMFGADFNSEPKSVSPAEGIGALRPVIGGLQLAWGVKKLDPGSPEEFIEAWAERFGRAAMNRFPTLSRLPDGQISAPSR